MQKTSFSPLLLAKTITSLLMLAGNTPPVLYRENFSFSLLWARFHNPLLLLAVLLSNLSYYLALPRKVEENKLIWAKRSKIGYKLLRMQKFRLQRNVELTFLTIYSVDTSNSFKTFYLLNSKFSCAKIVLRQADTYKQIKWYKFQYSSKQTIKITLERKGK